MSAADSSTHRETVPGRGAQGGPDLSCCWTPGGKVSSEQLSGQGQGQCEGTAPSSSSRAPSRPSGALVMRSLPGHRLWCHPVGQRLGPGLSRVPGFAGMEKAKAPAHILTSWALTAHHSATTNAGVFVLTHTPWRCCRSPRETGERWAELSVPSSGLSCKPEVTRQCQVCRPLFLSVSKGKQCTGMGTGGWGRG